MIIIVHVLKYDPAQKTVDIPRSLQLEEIKLLVIATGSNREEAYTNYIHIGHKLHANNPKESQSAIIEASKWDLSPVTIINLSAKKRN